MNSKRKNNTRSTLKRNFSRLVLLMIGAAVVIGGPAASVSAVMDIVPTQEHVLENGLTVIVTPMPTSSLVSIYVLVKTGSATEGKFLGSGISHFMEHMLFKGTSKRGVGVITREIQALGGVINASTGLDYTIFTMTVPYKAFDQGLDIISDMVMNPNFDPEEVKKERDVVYREIKMHRDTPQRYLSECIFGTVYTVHPYRLPVIGYEDLLLNVSREDLMQYHRVMYIPNNMIVSIAGRVNEDDLLPKVKEAFKNFERKPYHMRHVPKEPAQLAMRWREYTYPTDLTRVSFVYSGVSINDPDLVPLDVLAMILGQGQNSRLYKEVLKKKKLVYSISASNFTPFDQGAFEIECVLDYDKLEWAQDAIDEQILNIQRHGVRQQEITDAQRKIAADYVRSSETTGSIAYRTSIDEALTGDYAFSKKYVELVNRVRPEDIKRVAEKYLVDQHLSAVVLKPEGVWRENAVKTEPERASEMEKDVLENGLTVLLREDHTTPLVSINLVVGGGVGQEPEALNGLSNLMAQAWIKGTKKYSLQTINKEVESRAIHLSSFSGYNSFGIRMNLLAPDIDFSLKLLEDFIKNPLFQNDEIEHERVEVNTAITAQNDSIADVTFKKLREQLFALHPLRREILGTHESVDKIKRDDLISFFNAYCVSNNMVLSIAGDFDKNELLNQIRSEFSQMKRQDVAFQTYHEPPREALREISQEVDKEQAMVAIGFQAVGLEHPDHDGLEVLSAILGSPFDGRIFAIIRDEMGLAYACGGGFQPKRDMGFVAFYVLTKAENIDLVKKTLLDLIQDVQENPVSEEDLANIKAYLKGQFARGMETNFYFGFMTALDELYGLGYQNYKNYAKRIDLVTASDIQTLAKTYLNINKAVIVISKPKHQGDASY